MKQGFFLRGFVCLVCIMCLVYLLRYVLVSNKYETFENSITYHLPLQFHVFSDMSYGNTRSWITKTQVNAALQMANKTVFEPCGIQWTMDDILQESVPLNIHLNDLFLLGPSSETLDDTTTNELDPRLLLYMSLVPKLSIQKQKTNVYLVNYLGPKRNGKTITSSQVERYSDVKMDFPAVFLGQYSQNVNTIQDRDISSIAFSLAHELCHVLGLPHTSDDIANVMYPDTSFSSTFSDHLLTESQIKILVEGAKIYQQKQQGKTTTNLKYDANAPIVDYHSSETQIRNEESQTPQNKIQILADDGSMKNVPMEKAQNLPTYFSPGTYPFGTANYVPIYADSMLLSKTAALNVTELHDTPDMMAGFCQQEKNNPMKLEEICMAMDKTKCASSQCCILLGGSKCVAGNEQGPKNVSHYNDTLLQNREFYYYQGKCYGNCI